jgi:type I site-specific restriction-modification system R (restriction) subunit
LRWPRARTKCAVSARKSASSRPSGLRWSRRAVQVLPRKDRELAIQQIVSRAVVSTEIVDILAAAGIQTPDISILSDEFLLEVQQMEKKNLGLEALRKLLNDSIRSRTRTNVVETRAFTERLEDAIARYHCPRDRPPMLSVEISRFFTVPAASTISCHTNQSF